MILCILINFAIFNKFKLNNKIVYLFFYFKIKYFINFFFYFNNNKIYQKKSYLFYLKNQTYKFYY